MRWPWRDRDPKDGQPSDYPLDSFLEMYVAWIAMMLTLIAVFVVMGYFFGSG